MATWRLRRAGAALAASSALAAALAASSASASDPSAAALDAARQRVAQPGAAPPPRDAQRAALAGSTPAEPLDVLVVGGGATGCGVALDAATRGLRVGLVEREDFSSGTSSRSTKLIHGGVRYLEKAVFNLDYGQLKLVFHALKERKQVIENAPHLCHALPCMTPCFNWFEVVYYWFGLKFYDLVAGRRLLHLSRYYSVDESVELFPTLAKNGHDRSLRGTVVYYDGQMNDSRLNVGLACTAAVVGGAVLNYAEVVSLIKDESGERIIGARIRDTLSGKEFETFAKVIVNAAGPFCDSVRKMANSNVAPMICPSSGVHIVLPDYYSPEGMGLIVPKTKDGRVVFMLPWLGRTVAGTTDSSTAITMLPEPHEDEIQFILDAISDYLNVQVRRSDVLSAWSGIRPLATDPSAKNTESISRDHVVFEDYPGLITITGGKWTTYRSMAEDAVNAAVRSGNLKPANGCVTDNLHIVGGYGWDPASFTVLAQNYKRMKKTNGGKVIPGAMDSAVSKHLSHAYGTLAEQVATIAQNEGLGKRLAHGYPFLEAEVAYCARYEYCESAVDFVARRCRLAFLDTDAAGRALPRIIEILASEHKWDKARKKVELHATRARQSTQSASPTARSSQFSVSHSTPPPLTSARASAMASSKPSLSFPFPVPAPDPSDEVVREFGPLLRVYKSGRIERPLVAPPVEPGHDAATGVQSKDVHLGSYSVRLYLPPVATADGAKAKLPVVVYVHGGGFVAESAASPGYHLFLNRLAAACPALVVSVDYRLAPEHPLPAGYDDCLAALKWVLSAADPWVAAHGDLARVFVAGDSAGGNVCHHLAIHPDVVGVQVQQEARHPPPPLKGAVLIHPWFWGSEAVGEEPADPAARAMGAGLWFFACPETSGMDDPRMNPMAPAAPGLHTLACERVMVCAAEGDFLRWRGRAYAEAVAAARGAGLGDAAASAGVELLETMGEGHVFYLFKPDCDKAKEMMDKMVAFINAP